jgi:glycine/D-amino acid oxidase-like deaminating enzyme
VTTDVLIAGAGIVGAAIAAAFRAEGGKCLVVDPDLVGGGATAAGMGHVVVMDDSPAQLALTAYSRRLWDNLDLPPNVEREHRGTLWVAADAEEMAEVARKHTLFPASEVLDERALYTAEPELRPGLAGGFFPDRDRSPGSRAHGLVRVFRYAVSFRMPPCAALLYPYQQINR